MTIMKTMKMMIKILLLLVVVSCNKEVPPSLSPSYPIENPEQVTIDFLKKDTAWHFSTKKMYYSELKDSVDCVHVYRRDCIDYWYFYLYHSDTVRKFYYNKKFIYNWRNKNGSIQ